MISDQNHCMLEEPSSVGSVVFGTSAYGPGSWVWQGLVHNARRRKRSILECGFPTVCLPRLKNGANGPQQGRRSIEPSLTLYETLDRPLLASMDWPQSRITRRQSGGGPFFSGFWRPAPNQEQPSRGVVGLVKSGSSE